MKILLDKIESVIPRMHGWCSMEKAAALVKSLVEEKPKTIVEIGVFGGRSLVVMALACEFVKWGHVYGIDPWTMEAALADVKEPENLKWWSELDYDDIYRHCLRTVFDQGLTKYCTLFRTTSERAVGLIDDVDMIHIDGNHSEVSSMRDVRLWLPKVKPGGLIWFDDIDWASTATAVKMLESACQRLPDVGTCGVFRKHVELV